jgi:tetratricopeptide (TPR) repeat protein
VESICPRCRNTISATDAFCSACGLAIAGDQTIAVQPSIILPQPEMGGGNDATIAPSAGSATGVGGPPTVGARSTTGLTRPAAGDSSAGDRLAPGESFAGRYHIIKLLAVGGMGAVYQAWDAELGVAVAIKTIRPDTLAGGDSQELERRFKRELLLAREVTHANVLRIHDLGAVDGIKYITMPFIDGNDLATVLRNEGRLPLARALTIFRQIVAGVRAAHAKQIIHRDLKPANVMLEEDHVYIMDFGIARGGNSTARTVAGHIVGTLDYMAPEQAQGKTVDARADIYALGLILRDMLIGRAGRPQTDNAITDLMQRIQSPLPPLRTIDPQVPENVDRLIERCTQIDPGARFQSTSELDDALAALDNAGQPRTPASASAITPAPAAPPRRRGVLLGAAAAMLTLGAAAAAYWMTRPTENATAAAHAPVSVVIANFDNRTGDSVFEGALEQVLSLGIEGAAFITAYPRDQALRVVREIARDRPLDEEHARLVAVREGIRLVLTGAIEAKSGGYSIVVRALDAAAGSKVADVEDTADSKADVVETVGRLAKRMRQRLGDADASKATNGRDETFTAGSIEAANAYARAQDLAGGGQFAPAIAAYQEAIQRDPNFGRAYSGWAAAAFNLGRPEEAEQLYQKALGLLERMTEREKYRTLGSYYVGPGANDEQAIVNYRALIERYPSDAIGFNNLAVAYFNTHDFRQAVDQGRKVVEIFPKYRTGRLNLPLYLMYAGDLAAATEEARKTLEITPVDKAYLPIAIAALARSAYDEAARAYDDMAKVSARGASIAGMGLADLAIYRGDFAAARAALERGVAADQVGNQRAPQAMKLVTLADLALMNGDRAGASRLVNQALELSRPDGVVVPAARVLIAVGRKDEARALSAELEKQVRKRRRALGALIRAELALDARRPVDAIDALTTARQLNDLWLVRFLLGRTYVEAGRFAEAVAELEECQKRPGEASAAFLDDWPTFRYTAPVSYWLGRAQEGLKLEQSARKNFEAYLALRGNVAGDALAADARKRIGRPQ